MNAIRRPVFIASGRHPFEVGPLLGCLIVGVLLAVADERPPSMTRLLPEPMLTGWLVILAAGGFTGLVGSWWRGDVDDALLIEFAGVLAVATMCTVYVIVLFAASPYQAVTAGGLLAGIAGGAWWRAGQCVRDWRKLRRPSVEDVPLTLPLVVEPLPDDAGGVT